jgi:hypothetical protein
VGSFLIWWAALDTNVKLDVLCDALKAETFDIHRASILNNLAKRRQFTCAEVREILHAFTFDSGRADAMVHLYPQITDLGDFLSLRQAFIFDLGWDELIKRLSREGLRPSGTDGSSSAR